MKSRQFPVVAMLCDRLAAFPMIMGKRRYGGEDKAK
jgi:hypothetical protein